MDYKPEPITDETLQSVAAEFLRTALGRPDTEVGEARERNLAAYNALPIGDFAPPEIADRSDFVATDVADTVDGMHPQILRMFTAGENAVECEAKKPEGVEVAKDATAYLNHIFYTENDGLEVLHDFLWDGLTQKVGFAQVWTDEEAEDSRETYEGITEETAVLLLQDGGQIVEQPQVDENGLLTLTIAKEGKRRVFKACAIAPHEMRIDPNARWGDEPAAVGRVYYKRKFELEADGIDCSELPTEGVGRWESESMELLGESDGMEDADFHESHRSYECADVYLRLDRDGDGLAEWLHVFMVGEQIAIRNGELAVQAVDDHPYVWWCPKPRPHAFFGECPADRAYQAQLQRTRLVRALFDNAMLTVNGRTYVNTSAGVNIDDLLDNRPGGVVRGERPQDEALSPLVQPSMPAPVLQLNEWLESWRESRTGFNRYSAGTDANALNKTKGGVQILTQKADMQMELIARFFAVGVRKLFAKLLRLVTKHQDAETQVMLNGRPLMVHPYEWRDQFNLKINVGLGQGTKEEQAARLMAMYGLQQGAVPFGIVRPEHLASTIRQLAVVNDFKEPEQFVDEQPSGMPPNPEAFQQMQQQMQEAMQQAQAEIEKLTGEKQQLEQQVQSKEMDMQVKAAELGLKERELGLKEAETGFRMQSQAVGMEAPQQGADALAQAAAMLAQAAMALAQVMQPRGMDDQGAGMPTAYAE